MNRLSTCFQKTQLSKTLLSFTTAALGKYRMVIVQQLPVHYSVVCISMCNGINEPVVNTTNSCYLDSAYLE